MSGCFYFAASKLDCLSGSCCLRTVMMFLSRVVWSALVVKWSASLLASSYAFTGFDVGVDPFYHTIYPTVVSSG